MEAGETTAILYTFFLKEFFSCKLLFMAVVSKLPYEDELWLNVNSMHRAHKHRFSPRVWFTSHPKSQEGILDFV